MTVRKLLFIATIAMLSLPTAARDEITLAVTGGRLIDGFGGRPLSDSVVLVSGDRIVAVGAEHEVEVPNGVRRVDAEGMTVMPGLIDLHVHFDIIGHGDYPHWFGSYEERMRSDIIPVKILRWCSRMSGC